MTDALTDSPPIVDLLVIGGGINGAGVAADAAGRGLSVMLVEKGDLASGTSSWSTKLINGGLRYIEFYEFGLVRKALLERDVLNQGGTAHHSPACLQYPAAATLSSCLDAPRGPFPLRFSREKFGV